MGERIYGELVSDGGEIFALIDIVTTLGRHNSSDICLRSPKASMRHCMLAFKGGQWWVRDLRSRNGTCVNGRRVTEVLLHSGDKLSVGDTTFTIQYRPPA